MVHILLYIVMIEEDDEIDNLKVYQVAAVFFETFYTEDGFKNR